MMKKILALLCGCIFLSLSAQEYSVPTELQLKNVLLEEFTAYRCGYCVDGHKVAARMRRAVGGRLSVVAVHCGRMAYGESPETEFRVDDGEIIGHDLGGTYGSFPSGSVDRRDWSHSGTLIYGRGAWQGYADMALKETAPLNLWARAVYDVPTRKLKIRVEGYFTADEVETSQFLNVLLVQNDVPGLQYSGGMGDHYPHQHMLRDAITGARGDLLENCQPHTYFVREFDYTVPRAYKAIPVEPEHLELVVFVSGSDRMKVQNVVTIKPEYVGLTLPLRAEILPDKIGVMNGYSFPYLPMNLENKSNERLTSATFDIVLNGKREECEWRGEVAPFATEDIRVPVHWSELLPAGNHYQVILRRLNGKEVEESRFQGTFGGLLQIPVEVTFKFHTNSNSEENTYVLYDSEGNAVRTFGPYGYNQDFTERVVLEPGKRYGLEITDFWGNGVFPYYNAVEIYDNKGLKLHQQDVIEGFGYRLFMVTPVPSGIDVVAGGGYDGRGIYDLKGMPRPGRNLPRGVYIVKSEKENHKVMVR